MFMDEVMYSSLIIFMFRLFLRLQSSNSDVSSHVFLEVIATGSYTKDTVTFTKISHSSGFEHCWKIFDKIRTQIIKIHNKGQLNVAP